MERKNTVLLTVIAIATLLVAVVGATFAYFTATGTGNAESAGKVNTNTATMENIKLTAASTGVKGKIDYPGGVMVAETSITAAIDGSSSSSNKYQVSYKLGLTGTNETQTDVKWYLLRSGDKAGVTADYEPSCELKIEQDGQTNKTKYYYANPSEGGSTCSAKSLIESQFSDLKLVAYGTVTNGTGVTISSGVASDLDIENNTPEGLENQILYTTEVEESQQFTTDHYYLVVEYPDTKEDQTTNDANGKTISLSLNSIDNIVSKKID